MNPPMEEPRGWTARDWTSAIALVAVLQVLAVFALSRPAPPASPARGPAPSVQWIRNSVPSSERPIELWSDPTAFALAHPDGFSRRLWRPSPPVNYETQGWAEPPRWMPPDLRRFGSAFHAFADSFVAPPRPLAAIPPPPPTEPPLRKRLVWKPSTRVSGELRGRPLLTPPSFPELSPETVLSNTVVGLGVAPEGEVWTAFLLDRSGSPKADAAAVEWASRARFEPAPDSAEGGEPTLTFGRIVFDWLAFEAGGPDR